LSRAQNAPEGKRNRYAHSFERRWLERRAFTLQDAKDATYDDLRSIRGVNTISGCQIGSQESLVYIGELPDVPSMNEPVLPSVRLISMQISVGWRQAALGTDWVSGGCSEAS
jgi:hypothetical protein